MVVEEWVEWQGETSSVVSLGLGTKTSPQALEDKNIYIIIPGNPGLAGFYQEFMETIYSSSSDPDLSIWAISHAGHHTQNPSTLPTDKTFGLEDQIIHKLHLLDKLIPTSARITLIGHSIGCKIIMEIAKRNSTHNFQGFYFLFPTIENMIDTPRGKETYPLTSTFRIPLIWATFLLSLLPGFLKRFLIRRVLHRSPDSIHDAVHHYLQPNSIHNCLVMAREEMDVLKQLDTLTIQKMAGRLRMYHGEKDGWSPLEYRDNLLQVEGIHEDDAVLDQEGMDHAFVLASSSRMGEILSEWMQKERKHAQ